MEDFATGFGFMAHFGVNESVEKKDEGIVKTKTLSKSVCIVSECSNSPYKYPDKYYFAVPRTEKRRKLWLLACRGFMNIQPNSHVMVCEDHFTFPDDLENYTQMRMMGVRPRLKTSVVPHVFNGKKVPPAPRVLSEARERKKMVEELLAESDERPSSSKGENLNQTHSKVTQIVNPDKSIFICDEKSMINDKSYFTESVEKVSLAASAEVSQQVTTTLTGDNNKRLLTHLDTSPFVCQTCNLPFVTIQHLIYHARKIHNISLLKQIVSQELYQELMSQQVFSPRMILPDIPIEQCNLCSKAFANKTRLRNHVYNVHEKKNAIMELTSSPRDIPLNGLPPFTCSLCGKGFCQKWSLTRHIRDTCNHKIETSKPPADIPVKGLPQLTCSLCGKSFCHKWSLSRHIRDTCNHKTETPQPPAVIPMKSLPQFTCSLCGKGFCHKWSLTRHIRDIHNIVTSQSPADIPVKDQQENNYLQSDILGQSGTDIVKVKPCCVLLDRGEVSRYLAAHSKDKGITANTTVQTVQDLTCSPLPTPPCAKKPKKCNSQLNVANYSKKMCTDIAASTSKESQFVVTKNHGMSMESVDVTNSSEMSKSDCLNLETEPQISMDLPPKLELDYNSMNTPPILELNDQYYKYVPIETCFIKVESNEINDEYVDTELEKQCDVCHFKSTCDATFNAHLLEHYSHSNSIFTFDNITPLNAEEELMVKNRCKKAICPKSFESEESLCEHYQTHDHSRMKQSFEYLQCKFCPHVFQSHLLESHIENQHLQYMLGLAGFAV